MTNLREGQRSVSQEATRWFLRLQAPDCTPSEKEAFNVWLGINPTHHQEFTALQAVWNRMKILETNPLPEFDTILAQRARVTPKWRSFGHVQITLAAAMVMVLVIGGAWWWSAMQVTVTAYQTALGERQIVTLADGTVMELNTKTSLAVHMSTHERRVVLEEGEVYFTIAHEEDRPFIVNTERGHIRDIGTKFSVRTHEDRVSVAVEEGAVQIDLEFDGRRADSDQVRQVVAGQRMAYLYTGRWSEVEQIDAQMIATWRHGKLIFEGAPLDVAIQEIGRYWPGQIILADTSMADIEVRGVIEIQNLEEFFQTLPNMLPVQVTHDSAGQMILSKR